MKKTVVLAGMCFISVFFAQCVKKAAPTKSNKAAEEVAEMNSKYTPEQIAQGKAVYVGSCQKCHRLYEPTEFKVKAWDKILPDMSHKADLNAEQAGLVRAWVITNTKQS